MQPQNKAQRCNQKHIQTSKVSDMIIEDKYRDSQYKGHSILFPYHCFNVSRPDRFQTVFKHLTTPLTTRSRLFNNFSLFPKVYAEDAGNIKNNSQTLNVTSTSAGPQSSVAETSALEALARAYIAKETGRERVRGIFQKNHKGEYSSEMFTINAALIQTFIISFLLKYVPAWNLAKQDFIREHNATAFRTNIDAVRKMSDFASYKGILEGLRFGTKITLFVGGFVTLSQMIASYRNKTSVLEYSVAGGITGGIARLQLGPKGFVAGSLLGTFLGTVLGGVTYMLFYSFGCDEENRHLHDIMSRLEVERSIIGDSVFKQRLKELVAEQENARQSA